MNLHPVTIQMANGSVINWALFTMAQPVVQSRMVRIVSAMADLIWVIFIGGGNQTNAIYQGLNHLLFSNWLGTNT